jgi:hypothetical protein
MGSLTHRALGVALRFLAEAAERERPRNRPEGGVGGDSDADGALGQLFAVHPLPLLRIRHSRAIWLGFVLSPPNRRLDKVFDLRARNARAGGRGRLYLGLA